MGGLFCGWIHVSQTDFGVVHGDGDLQEPEGHKKRGGRAVLKGGGGEKRVRNTNRNERSLSASWPWDLLYFNGWRLAVGGWPLAAVCGWWSMGAVLN